MSGRIKHSKKGLLFKGSSARVESTMDFLSLGLNPQFDEQISVILLYFNGIGVGLSL